MATQMCTTTTKERLSQLTECEQNIVLAIFEDAENCGEPYDMLTAEEYRLFKHMIRSLKGIKQEQEDDE
jgi:hypothetical protein